MPIFTCLSYAEQATCSDCDIRRNAISVSPSRVAKSSRRTENSPPRNVLPAKTTSSENVEHWAARREQIVCDDAPMTSPPNGLSTHNYAPATTSQIQ